MGMEKNFPTGYPPVEVASNVFRLLREVSNEDFLRRVESSHSALLSHHLTGDTGRAQMLNPPVALMDWNCLGITKTRI